MLTLPDVSTASHRRQLDTSPPLPPPRKLRPRGLSKFDQEREKEIVRQASKKGYLKSASRSFVLAQSVEKGKSFSDLTYINLAGLHLKDIGAIGLCGKLKICILNNNYIKEFNMLQNCQHLVALDLHSNQISTLPGPGFWLTLSSLKLLLLHDNTISKLQAIHNIAYTSDLIGLTLYDTPLSLRPTYRHHVVNSIFSLKALDHYVISDEEIIEDAVFDEPFACQSSALYVNMSTCQLQAAGDPFLCEMNNISRILKQINITMSHYSPVIIMQRLIRGYLTRRRVAALLDNRIWATVTVQRFWRHVKGLPTPPPLTDTHTPAHTVYRDVSQLLDYDTYINQQMAVAASASQTQVQIVEPQQTTAVQRKSKPAGLVQLPTPVTRGPHARDIVRPLGLRRNISVNLKNLEFKSNEDQDSAIIQTMASFNNPEKRALASPDPPKPIISVKITETSRNSMATTEPDHAPDNTPTTEHEPLPSYSRAELSKTKSVMRTSKHELVDEVGLSRSRSVEDWEEDGESSRGSDVIQFRLQGVNVGIQHIDPVETLYYNRRDAGHDVRSFHDEFHRQQQVKPHKLVGPRKFVTAEQRLFAKSRGAMALSCLIAVDHAYQDRTKAERVGSKVGQADQVRSQLSEGKVRVKSYIDFQRKACRDERLRDKMMSADMIKERKQLQREDLEWTAERSQNRRRKSRRHQDDYVFANNFNCQRTSVSNALIKHDLSAKKEDSLLSRSEFVSRLRNSSKDQHEIVKHYMQHRNVQMRTENAAEQADIASKVFQETNDRLLQAQVRVAQLRQRTRIIEELYPIPQPLTLTHSELSPLPPVHSRHSLPNLSNPDPLTSSLSPTTSKPPSTPSTQMKPLSTETSSVPVLDPVMEEDPDDLITDTKAHSQTET